MPLRMTPNFEDLSCEFVFGQEAARADEDPLMKEVRFNGIRGQYTIVPYSPP